MDLILTSKISSFQITRVTGTGCNDYYKLIFQISSVNARSKTIYYRITKLLMNQRIIILHDKNNLNISVDSVDPNQCYDQK